MHIKKAMTLKRGDMVTCPADRGSAAFTGKVTGVTATVNKTVDGTEYIWVSVRGFGSDAVWPSNRLS